MIFGDSLEQRRLVATLLQSRKRKALLYIVSPVQVGLFIIQLVMGFLNRDLVKQLQANPYCQYFMRLPRKHVLFILTKYICEYILLR